MKFGIDLDNEKVVKVIGGITMVAGVGLSIAESILSDKAMDRKIDKRISNKMKHSHRGYSKH